MNLNAEQQDNKAKIEAVAKLIGIDPNWAVAVAMVESSLGVNQKSPTGCLGVFQMSSIAMKELRRVMETNDDDWVDILCGLAFLKALLKRHKTIQEATHNYCDPKDKVFYYMRVRQYMDALKETE